MELSTQQAAVEQQESRIAAEMEAERGVAAEVAVRVQKETLEETGG